MSNACGETIKVDREREYKIFDALPSWVRAIIRDAVHDVSVEQVARLYMRLKKEGYTQGQMTYLIKRALP